MASKTLHAHDYAPGTVVAAYLREQLTNGGPPTGTAVDSSTVAGDGSLTFDGLTAGLRYVAYAGGRPVSFFMEPGSLDLATRATAGEVAELGLDIAAVEARTTTVESGIESVSLKGLGADHTGVVAADSYFTTALATGRPIDLGGPENTYKLSAVFATSSDLRVIGNGATVDMRSITPVSNVVTAFRVAGSCGAKLLLSVDGVKKARTVTLASVSGLAAGDWIEVGMEVPTGTFPNAIPSSGTADISLTAGHGMSGSVRLKVDNEVIAGTISTNTLTSVVRAQDGTTIGGHSAGTTWYERSSTGAFPARGTNPVVARGEKKQIRSITGNDVTFRQYLYDDYFTARSAFVRKLTMPSAHVNGVKFLADDNASTQQQLGVDLYLVNDFAIDVDTTNLNSMGVQVKSCIRGKINGATFTGPLLDDTSEDFNTFYGVGLYDGTQWVRVYGCHAESLRRLGVTSSHSAGQDFYGCPRFINVFGITGQEIRVELWEHHGFGEKVRVSDLICDGCDGLVRIEGPGITVSGGQVSNYRSAAIAISSDIVEAYDITVRDIDVWARADDANASRAVFAELQNATIIKDVWFEDIRVHEWDLLTTPAIDIDGTAVTAVDSGIRNCRVTAQGTRSSYLVELNPPGWVMEGGSIVASGYGARMNGDSQRVSRVDFQLSDAAAGPAVLVNAPNQKLIGCTGTVAFAFASVQSGATTWAIENNVVKVPSSGRCIVNGTPVAGRARNNSWELASGSFSVASATSMALSPMGNQYWQITGTTTINFLTAMVDGTEITIEAAAAATLAHNVAGAGTGFAKMLLNGGANLVLSAEDIVKLVYRGGVWRQAAPVSVN